MAGMGNHSDHHAAGAPLRRAKVCAWIVTVVMGATTMTFQVYHSVTSGEMAWPLAGLEGVSPLLIALLLMEVAAVWKEAPATFRGAVYVIMGGAMFWGAAATGAVVLHTAPWHMQLLFGVLLDGAELAAAYFIMNGPAAAMAVAAVARREAELLEAAAAERSARERDRAEFAAEADRIAGQAETTLSALRAELAGTATALASARQEAAEALGRADALSAKLDAASGRKQPKASAPRAARAVSAASARDGDVTTELQALMELRANPDLRKPRMGGELARVLGVSPATGRRYHKQYVNADGSLKEPLAEPLADRSS
jgi:hypothetical protein